MSQKKVLITGCTPGGIGYATAQQFLAKGWKVIATGRSQKVLDQLTEEGMVAVQLDVADPASIATCRETVGKIVDGKLDILINNAGRGLTTPSTDVKLEDARAVFETNLFGLIEMINRHVDLLIPAKGLIINISSASSVIPYWCGSVYAASKAAVSSYSRSLRMELEPFGVRVMVVVAGTVKSNIAAHPKGGLPENSLYQRVRHLYESRLQFSQKTSTMSTDQFARKLVESATASERPGFLRLWFGRPDWFWYGGMASSAWWGSVIGEWATDFAMKRMFRLTELDTVLKEERRLKQA